MDSGRYARRRTRGVGFLIGLCAIAACISFLTSDWPPPTPEVVVFGMVGLTIGVWAFWRRWWWRSQVRIGKRYTIARDDQRGGDVCVKCGYLLEGSPLAGPMGGGLKAMRCQCPECGHWNMPLASYRPGADEAAGH